MTSPAPETETEYVVVPTRPTVTMCQGGQRFYTENENVDGDDAASIYGSMLAARPDSGMVPVPRELPQSVIDEMLKEIGWDDWNKLNEPQRIGRVRQAWRRPRTQSSTRTNKV